MDWIKVTPETMPPDMEPVMVTVSIALGVSDLWTDFFWNESNKQWMVMNPDTGEFHELPDGFMGEITHWMPYPKPAKWWEEEQIPLQPGKIYVINGRGEFVEATSPAEDEI